MEQREKCHRKKIITEYDDNNIKSEYYTYTIHTPNSVKISQKQQTAEVQNETEFIVRIK